MLKFELYWTGRCNVDFSLRGNLNARYEALLHHIITLFDSCQIEQDVAVSILFD